VRFRDAGHILGSSMIEVTVREGAEQRVVLFSGDVGRWDVPILRDPTPAEKADYVVTESTYGNRDHKDNAGIPDALAEIIRETRADGGNVIIPSFAVERAQELLYVLNELLQADRIPHLMVFVDSPMAISVTDVFKRHPELFDEDARAMLAEGRHPCQFPGLRMSRSVDQSKAINHIRGTAIVIAGSGMCTGGRIKHHLVNNIGRPESTVLFVGYQANGTLGRIILEGAKRVRILGREHTVRARIRRINGFSAHADRGELHRWLSSLQSAPRGVFVTHGEAEAAAGFASWLKGRTGWPVSVATYRQTVSLD
jgi:metallo-beta-lactamase family protein